MIYGRGGAVNAAALDDDARDAVFLARHPGWTWRDLQDTPARVVDYLRAIETA